MSSWIGEILAGHFLGRYQAKKRLSLFMDGQTITILRFVTLVTAREEPGWGKLKKWSGQAIHYENIHSKVN